MRFLLLVSLFVSACATQRPEPALLAPKLDATDPGYRVWNEGALWRVRVAAVDGKPHRFQGSVDGLTGGIIEVTPDRETLREHVAQVGNSVQFDFEVAGGDEGGFATRVTGGCLRFDLLLDGKRRPERVRLGALNDVPSKLPVQRCP